MFVWLALIAIATLLYYYLVKSDKYKKWEKLGIPYVKALPIVGNMGPFVIRQKAMSDLLMDIYNSSNSRYIGIYSFNNPALLIKDVELIKNITVKEFEHFHDHRAFISEEQDPLFGKNLIGLKGQRWKQMRSTLSPTFTGNKMRSMFTLMSETAEQFVNHYLNQIGPNETKTLEMKTTLHTFANDVIASSAFGIKCDSFKDDQNQFLVMAKDASNFKGLRSLKIFGYDLSPTLMKFFKVKLFSDDLQKFFTDLVVNNMAMREKEGIVRPDMIHLLMEAKKGNLKYEEDNENDKNSSFAATQESHIGKNQKYNLELSDEDITAQVFVFFLAGFDTIATVMSHIAYELALNPDIQEKLQKEIDSILKKNNNEITYENVVYMKYLDMVVSETLRKWAPSPVIERICNDSYTIEAENPDEKTITLEKGDNVWIPVYPIQRDPKYYPNPEKFDPERFSDENKSQIHPFSYMPFGLGPRNCIGSRFALMETKVLIFYVLSKFNFVKVDKTEIPLQISKQEFNVTAANGFWLGLKRREVK